MDAKLQERCNLQIENERIIRQSTVLEKEESVKLGALLFTAIGLKADPEKIQKCRQILKTKTGLFSNFRGTLQFVVLLKMTLMEDPEQFIDGVIETYEKLTEHITFPGLIPAMVAVTIYQKKGDRDPDELIKRILDIYSTVKRVHPHLTNEADMGYITLMVLADRATGDVEEEKEAIYLELKKKYQLTSEVAQAAALVLLTSGKPAVEKVEHFIALYEAVKEGKHATAKNRFMSIYGVFADLDLSVEKEAAAICEVDSYLKDQKGYRTFSSGTDFRKVLAATLTLQYYTIDEPAWPKERTEAEEVSIDALLFILIMNLVVMI